MFDHTWHAMFKSSSLPIRLNLLPWPAYSSDLSSVENVWFVLAQRLADDAPPADTLNQLRGCVEAAWSTVLQGYLQNLLGSMQRRLVAVIANNGGYVTEK
ncbi:hypothetical protein TNCV_881571 [Trichonephila clavipes]|nr:hypothetical protein TNCV_881571 [Trichonephila clavipes]